MVERDESEREILYVVDEKYVPRRHQWTKHINNLVEQGQMEKAMRAARDMMTFLFQHTTKKIHKKNSQEKNLSFHTHTHTHTHSNQIPSNPTPNALFETKQERKSHIVERHHTRRATGDA